MGKIQIRTAQTERFQMDYFSFGKGAESLVILPGLSVQSVMGSADVIAEQFRNFTEAYTVYVFDRRKELPASYPVSQMAEDTFEALRVLGIRKADFYGASQGGMIALKIAADHPETVRKVVLGSSGCRVTEECYSVIEGWARLAEEKKAEELYLAFGRALYPEALFEQSKALLRDMARTVTEEELERFVILAEGAKGFDLCGELERISCPVLVTADRDDQVLGWKAIEETIEAFQARPGSAVQLYEGYGHAVYDLAPDFKKKMLAFFMDEAAI